MKKKFIITAVLLTAVVTVTALAAKGKLNGLLPQAESGPLETNKGAVLLDPIFPEETIVGNTTNQQTEGLYMAPMDTDPPVTTVPVTVPTVTEPPATEPPVTEAPVTAYNSINDIPKASPTQFDSSLFIGDSRTVGLNCYADLGNATVFATKGMNVFRAANEKIEVSGQGKIDLDGVLNAKKYDKIYIMLGINEIGYNQNAVIKKYTEIVNKVLSAQPEATIYLQANLHITSKRSDTDSVYNNSKLNSLNEGMAALANGTNIFYIDVNSVFDDENGALATVYAADDFHLLGNYYSVWADWIAQNS